MKSIFVNKNTLAIAVGVLLSNITLQAQANTAPKQPNILVIMADDLGWSDIEPYGSEIPTPYLDELAKQGVSFTNFFVSPYSSPSRAMFLTGVDPHQVGLGNIYELNTPDQAKAPNYVGHLTDNSLTIAQRLKQAGYHTILSGKWHLGKKTEHQPNAWGFNDSFALLNGEANNWRYQDKLDSPDGRDLYSHNGIDAQLPEGEFSTDFYTDYLLESLNKKDEAKRMQLYAAMIDNMDHNIGRVINHLKQTGQYDNTVILFLSDNGAAGASREASAKWGGWIKESRFNDYDNLGKASSYVSTGPIWAQASMTPFALFKGYMSDGAIRSPLIISGKGISQGLSGKYSTMADLAPTILDIAGVTKATAPDKTPLQGSSLADTLTNPSKTTVQPISPASFEMRGGRQVRMGNFKATFLGTLPAGIPPAKLPVGKWRLFDIATDPAETTDISDKHPEVLAQMIHAYEKYSADVGVVELNPIRPPSDDK
ncbi:sulfatase-like hydrolase/transferase [Moraxella bovoculi]|uniref:sulfatase-like hydrolase/transferase n=1 Tax=Moraxella bovoculi TaxID=386891 RepID=UPI00156EA3FB|nr:sulfatase-like hydrolase/transferase [Moraxella bovoculi]NSM11136.1 sulfatase-like hydrolase/transferase [Moraxella bovoculi]